jgi:hypothetical protein
MKLIKNFRSFFICILLLMACLSLQAQKDSIEKKVLKQKDSLSLVLDKRPRNAALLGLIIPGAGQVYNKRWWKLPIVYGAYGLAYYNLKFNRDVYKKYDGYYQTALKDGKVVIKTDFELDVRGAKLFRDRARDNRDVALFTLIGVHVLAILEAYVDAHLKNFNIDDDLSFKFSPQTGGMALVYALH